MRVARDGGHFTALMIMKPGYVAVEYSIAVFVHCMEKNSLNALMGEVDAVHGVVSHGQTFMVQILLL